MHGRIYLVGMMGSGKTTGGKRLAERLGLSFFDNDEQIEKRTGKTAQEYITTLGEYAFREKESATLNEIIQQSSDAIIAVGGGTVLREENRKLMKDNGKVVWLRGSVETLLTRVGDGNARPLLTGDPQGKMNTIYAEREPLYAEIADIATDTDSRSLDQVVDAIVELLEKAS